ncbi:hypothetical protein Afil01_56430 [Actinorhabdospora filicis]|uniref:DUF4241 domain-containing protein n=1 Tax=Actinorhabdospora filicis TaxID=1785913 RepID=A0A9W6SR75_9ACTN|nr:DUF4241 domain-containing protein [Actinorhabdospora filicis]GLZ80836.1 hypothetical protein Afil01_56430 [Actinorhabdospora filicis]
MSETPRTLRTGGFDAFFAAGRRIETPTLDAVIEVVELGRLALPSGRLAACDPSVVWELEPFTAELPPGDHPVELAVADVATVNGVPQQARKVAAARVVIAAEAAASWEMAVVAGQDTASLSGDLYFGYGVDAGIGAFLDAEAAKALDRINDADELDGALATAREGDLGALVGDTESGLNVAAFPSGWGNGVYPTWVGRAADGRVVSVVTDFHVF